MTQAMKAPSVIRSIVKAPLEREGLKGMAVAGILQEVLMNAFVIALRPKTYVVALFALHVD